MSILDSLAARLGYAKAQPMRAPGEMLSIADSYRWNVPEAAEAEKQMRLYAALTWISTAIDRTAEIAAQAELHVRRIVGEPGGADDEEILNHEFEKLFDKNPMQSRGEFLRDAFTMYRITGNLYLYLNAPSETTPPDELWIVPSHMIAPIPDGHSYISGYKFTPPGYASKTIDPWKIVHLKTSNPTNPFIGLSAIQSLALDAYGDLAQQKWNLAHFDKNNAKLPSILAFKHMVADPEWKKIKAERDQEWGGTNRAGVTLLRGVGDSLQLIQASATQKDMEFLAARNFTKEEIFGKLAPGLASILAVNATEANAIAGKSTLIEFGVWPTLVQFSEKFNSKILPLYGENERCEYEDMRQTNRILDLQEQAEYAKTHTINQINAEYHNEGPLELDPDVIAAMPEGERPKSKLDPRGFLFPVQIGPSAPGPKLEAPKPEPVPGQIPPDQVPGQSPIAQTEGNALPPDNAQMQAQQAEMKAWENFALKRLGRPGWREFEPRVLDVFAAGRIRTALKAAQTAGEVRQVFEREAVGADILAEAVAELRRYNNIAGAIERSP